MVERRAILCRQREAFSSFTGSTLIPDTPTRKVRGQHKTYHIGCNFQGIYKNFVGRVSVLNEMILSTRVHRIH